jgi:hypothetical protein
MVIVLVINLCFGEVNVITTPHLFILFQRGEEKLIFWAARGQTPSLALVLPLFPASKEGKIGGLLDSVSQHGMEVAIVNGEYTSAEAEYLRAVSIQRSALSNAQVASPPGDCRAHARNDITVIVILSEANVASGGRVLM